MTRISSELGRINDRIRQIDEANAGTKALCGRLKEEVAKSLTSSEGPSYTRPDAKWRSLSPGNGGGGKGEGGERRGEERGRREGREKKRTMDIGACIHVILVDA